MVVEQAPDKVTFGAIVIKGRSPLVHWGDGVPLFLSLGDLDGVGGMGVKLLQTTRGNHL